MRPAMARRIGRCPGGARHGRLPTAIWTAERSVGLVESHHVQPQVAMLT